MLKCTSPSPESASQSDIECEEKYSEIGPLCANVENILEKQAFIREPPSSPLIVNESFNPLSQPIVSTTDNNVGGGNEDRANVFLKAVKSKPVSNASLTFSKNNDSKGYTILMVLLILYSGLGCIGSTNLSLYIVPIILSALSFFYDIDSTLAEKFSVMKFSINSFLMNHFGFELQLPFRVQGSKNELNVNAKLFCPEKVDTPRVCHVGGSRKSIDNMVHVNRGDMLIQEVLAQSDHLYDGKILELNNDIGAGSNLNFRVPVSVNGMNPVLAELDSDAHISLLSEQFFEQLKACTKITYLHSEEPTIFYGIGSQV